MTDELFSSARPRTKSRGQAPRTVLQQLRRLRGRAQHTLEHRQLSGTEQRWTGRVYDALEQLVSEGDQVLPGQNPPDRKVRKRR
jgi:hypothetical protein